MAQDAARSAPPRARPAAGRVTRLPAVTPAPRVAPTPVAESLTMLQLMRQSESLYREAELSQRRGATYTAREMAISSLRALAAASDLRDGGCETSRAVDAALAALREAGDFLGRYGHVDSAVLSRMVDSHATPLLKGSMTADMSPHAAADAYLDFARRKLTRAADGRPEAAMILTLLAEIERAGAVAAAGARGAEGGTTGSGLGEATAITYLRAAVSTNPRDARAASELGHLSLHAGLLDEARWALEHSLALQPDPATAERLAATYRLAGLPPQSPLLDAQPARATLAVPTRSPAKTLLVTPLEPREFAAISPPVQGAPAQAAQTVASPAPNLHGAGPSPPPSAPRQSGLPTIAPAAQAPQAAPAATPPSVAERVASALRGFWH